MGERAEDNHPQMPHQATAEYFGQQNIRSKAVAALEISLNRLWVSLQGGGGLPGTYRDIQAGPGSFMDTITSPWYA